MTRKIEVEFETRAKKFTTVLDRFFKKYPELDYWREVFEYMYENNEHFFSDNRFANGKYNFNWCYALHLDVFDDDSYYICIIERV